MKHWFEVRNNDDPNLLKTSDNKVGELLKRGEGSSIYQIENGYDISSLATRFTLIKRQYSIGDKLMYIGKEMRITHEEPCKLDSHWKVCYTLDDDEGNECRVFEEDLIKNNQS